MAKLKIVQVGDPILRKVSRPVEEITPRIRQLIDDMIETMRDADGCGLTRLDYAGGKSMTMERPSKATLNCGLYLLDMPFASVVYGTTGSMVFAPNDRALLFDRNGALAKYWEGRDPESVAFAGSLEVPLRNLDIRQLAHFAACVKDREIRPYATLADALAVRRRYAAYS